MISRQTTADTRELRPVIQGLLNQWCKDHRASFTLRVAEEIVQQDEWTYYIVVPDRGEVRAYEYATALADVEGTLRREKHEERVLLVPALPD
jgi:hypothetical protein